jgi:hypothetical protein
MADIILWRRVDMPGHEIARLDAFDAGWKLSGSAIFLPAQRASKLEYSILCDSAWRTNSARISGTIGDREVNLSVVADAERRWRLNDVECRAVEGCIDIDLGFSPSTNLLPIRRLALAVGQQAEVLAAWLPFPSLRFELLPQVYHRESESRYRYQSAGGAFVRMLDVNAAGFVTSYPGLWEAERAAS